MPEQQQQSWQQRQEPRKPPQQEQQQLLQRGAPLHQSEGGESGPRRAAMAPTPQGDEGPSLFESGGGQASTTAMDRAVLHNPTVIALIGLLLRCCVGLHPHSGQGKPPLFGEFEAQRLQLEVAVQTPLREWYSAARFAGGQGAFPYPPLNAYLSLAFGSAAHSLVPNLVAPGAVGYEGEDARAFMRASVLLCDITLFFTATWFFCILFYRSNVALLTRQPHFPDELKDTAARFLLYSRRSPLPVEGGVDVSRGGSSSSSSSSNSSSVSCSSTGAGSTGAGSTGAGSTGAGSAGAAGAVEPGTGGRLTRRGRRPSGTASSFSSTVMSGPVALVSEVFLIILLQPAFVLVDHGQLHFSAVFLGLTLWALVFCLRDSLIPAALAFGLALNYNQVVLYYAPAMALYLLGHSMGEALPWRGLLRLASFVAALALTFVLLWLPVCEEAAPRASCAARAASTFVHGPRGVTLWPGLVGLVPCCLDLLRHRGRQAGTRRLLWALFNCSLSFYLWSHAAEGPAVLLPLLPAALLVGDVPGPSWWFSLAAAYSLAPLLAGDGLTLPAVVSVTIFAGTNAVCFRGELCFLPLPWVDHDSASMEGIRHGIRMVDSTAFLRACATFTAALFVLALLGPHHLWRGLHHAFIQLFMGAAWFYGTWYQINLPEEEPQLESSSSAVSATPTPSSNKRKDI